MIEKLLSITQEFIDLLLNEQGLLKAHKLGEASRLHEEKDRLNGEYQLAMLQFRSQIKELNDIPPGKLECLYQKTTEMRDLLKTNEYLLTIVSQANSRIISALSERLSSHSTIVEGYSRFGETIAGKIGKAEALAVSQGV